MLLLTSVGRENLRDMPELKRYILTILLDGKMSVEALIRKLRIKYDAYKYVNVVIITRSIADLVSNGMVRYE